MTPGKLPEGAEFWVSDWGHSPDPGLARLALCLISDWSRLDLERTHAITRMMHAHHVAIGAMLEVLHGPKDRALMAAAKSMLTPEDFGVFRRIELYIRPIRELRNRLVHYVWASSPDVQDSILLIKPASLMNWLASRVPFDKDPETQVQKEVSAGDTEEAVLGRYLAELDPDLVEVHSRDEIEHELEKVHDAHSFLRCLEFLVEGGDAAKNARAMYDTTLPDPQNPWPEQP